MIGKPGDKSSQGALFIGVGVEMKCDVEVPAAQVDGSAASV